MHSMIQHWSIASNLVVNINHVDLSFGQLNALPSLVQGGFNMGVAMYALGKVEIQPVWQCEVHGLRHNATYDRDNTLRI